MPEIFIWVFLIFNIFQVSGHYRTVCFYDAQTHNNSFREKLQVQDIDPFLCTNIIIFYSNFENKTLNAIESDHLSTLWSRGLYERCSELKKLNPELKISLGINGNHTFVVIFFRKFHN
jgi:hypothetical protein